MLHVVCHILSQMDGTQTLRPILAMQIFLPMILNQKAFCSTAPAPPRVCDTFKGFPTYFS